MSGNNVAQKSSWHVLAKCLQVPLSCIRISIRRVGGGGRKKTRRKREYSAVCVLTFTRTRDCPNSRRHLKRSRFRLLLPLLLLHHPASCSVAHSPPYISPAQRLAPAHGLWYISDSLFFPSPTQRCPIRGLPPHHHHTHTTAISTSLAHRRTWAHSVLKPSRRCLRRAAQLTLRTRMDSAASLLLALVSVGTLFQGEHR